MRRTPLSIMTFAILAAAAPAAYGALHFHLVKSVPEKEAMLEKAPPEIKLWFSEEPQEATTSLRLIGPDDELVELAELAQSEDDAKVFSVRVSGRIPDGVSKVVWRAMGRDGHVVRGDYTFSVHSMETPGR